MFHSLLFFKAVLDSPKIESKVHSLNIFNVWNWSWSSNTLATYAKNWLGGKDPEAGKDQRQEEKGTTEDEIVGWHHQLNGHEFEQALGDGEGQGSLASCSWWGPKESDMTELLNKNQMYVYTLQPCWSILGWIPGNFCKRSEKAMFKKINYSDVHN